MESRACARNREQLVFLGLRKETWISKSGAGLFNVVLGKSGQSGLAAVDHSVLGQAPSETYQIECYFYSHS